MSEASNTLSLGIFTTIATACMLRSNRTLQSHLLGFLDHLASRLGTLQTKYYTHGYSEEAFAAATSALSKDLAAQVPSDVRIGPWSTETEGSFARASFHSPIALHLPDEDAIQTVHMEIALPPGRTLVEALVGGLAVVIHLPATGDEGFGLRRRHLVTKLLPRNIISISLQLPFYGGRRAKAQDSAALLRLENMAQQSLAAAMESNQIVSWVKSLGHTGSVCFTGISFGGSMCALASLHCGFDHAAVGMVSANSPRDAYVHGVMAHAVDWHALVPAHQSNEDKVSAAKNLTARLLGTMDIAATAREQTYPQPRRVYTQFAACHDAYIPFQFAAELHEGMSKVPGMVAASLVLLPGGHASAVLFERERYLDSIVEALKVLESN